MDYERLIALVKSHEELYNVYSRRYSDHLHKEAVWRNIAISLNQSAIVCKKAWINLRDSFRRTIRKKKEAKELNIGKKKRKWRFEDQMSFIIPHFQERDTQLHEALMKEDSGDKTVEAIVKEESEDLDINSLAESEEDLTHSSYQEDLLHASFSKCTSTESTHGPTKHSDALELFLASMAASIRTFPPYHQNIAKSKIFAAVSEIELGLILKNRSSSPQPPKGVGVHFLESG